MEHPSCLFSTKPPRCHSTMQKTIPSPLRLFPILLRARVEKEWGLVRLVRPGDASRGEQGTMPRPMPALQIPNGTEAVLMLCDRNFIAFWTDSKEDADWQVGHIHRAICCIRSHDGTQKIGVAASRAAMALCC